MSTFVAPRHASAPRVSEGTIPEVRCEATDPQTGLARQLRRILRPQSFRGDSSGRAGTGGSRPRPRLLMSRPHGGVAVLRPNTAQPSARESRLRYGNDPIEERVADKYSS